MADIDVVFTNRYEDLSTDQGHQWEFFCGRCGKGYTSTFKSSTVSNLGSKAAQGLGGMFGGKLSKVASQGENALHGVAEPKEREKAMSAAVAEIQQKFHRCNQCREWVCEDVCWDEQYGLCVACGELERRAQETGFAPARPSADPAQVEQVAQFVGAAFSGLAKAQAPAASKCPQCHAEVAPGAKFCPECGQAISANPKCANCGAESLVGTKFCPECGTSMVSA
jgi:hypothetical protein